MKEILVSSLVSGRDGSPRVDILLEGKHIQLSQDEAVHLSTNILKCAEGAMVDSFLMLFIVTELKQEPEIAGRILQEFRDYREKLLYGATPQDWRPE